MHRNPNESVTMNPRLLLRPVLLCLVIGLVISMTGSGSASDILPNNTSNSPGIIPGGFAIRPDIAISDIRSAPEGYVPTPDGPLWDGDHSKPDIALIEHIYQDLETRLGNSTGRPRLAPPPQLSGGLPSKGTVRVPVFLVDFADAPHLSSQTPGDIQSKMFGAGNANLYPVESLRNYYQRSSNNQLTIQGDVYGWYRSPYTRAQYQQAAVDYEEQYASLYGEGIGVPLARSQLICDVIEAYDSQVDFSRYDNNNDGVLDAVYVKWAGIEGEWDSLWWACQGTNAWVYSVDGKEVGEYVSSWYSSEEEDLDSTYPLYSPRTDIHETGHLLGLPDYYDYDRTVGPDGGVGGWDMMDSNWGDHNVFSKYLLGWLTPTLITQGGQVLDLQPSSISRNAVLIMPGTSLNTFSEFFMAEYRAPGTGNDPSTIYTIPSWNSVPFTTKGLFLWHVDARLLADGTDFAYDNSWATHKLLRLMEADGQEHLEREATYRGGYFDQNDIYTTSRSLGPITVPNSNTYAGQRTDIIIDQIQMTSSGGRAHFAVGSAQSLTVTSITPSTGAQGSSFAITNLAGTGFQSGAMVKLTRVGSADIVASAVTVVSASKITCQIAIPLTATAGAWNVVVTNPGGASATLANRFSVTNSNGEPWFTPHLLPCTVEAEDYDVTGAGSAFSDTTAANEGRAYRTDAVDIELISGGYTLCYIREGEWTKYTVESATAATYPVTLRVANWATTPARTIELQVDDVTQKTVTAPKTASNTAFTTVSSQLAIPAGRHTVTLKFHGGSMNLDSLVFGGSQPVGLTAAFVASPTSGPAPLQVQFVDTSTGTPTTWNWNFGDGTTSTQQNPSHTYSAIGTYTVSLTVGNGEGQSNTKTRMGLVTVTTVPLGNLGDAVDAPQLVWTTDPTAPWTVDTANYKVGGSAARSGVIGHSGSSRISTTVTGPAELSFYMGVSSQDSDQISFLLDGAERVRMSGNSGAIWGFRNVFSIGDGTHTLTWVYSKDATISAGSDAGWLDGVSVVR